MIFKCIVVLYNTYYKDSISYSDLIQTEYYKKNQMEIICVDNSVKDYGNQELMTYKNHFYIDMGGNKGLSKAYNAAIEHLSERQYGEENLIVLLDDDTHIGNDYFVSMEKAFQLDGDIFLPVVCDQVGILSPSLMRKFRCRRCKSLEQINEKNICGINSGMAIKESILINYRYDERIFLDYVDHSFIRDMKQLKKKIIIVDTKLYQNFSSVTDSYEQTLKRFQIFKDDIKIFYSGGIVDKIIYYYVVYRRKLGISLKFKKITFLWKQ